MGQQQLLLVVLGVILVGVAVVLGISLFNQNAITVKRDNLVSECMSLSGLAQQYYSRPTALGGGNRSFAGWAIPTELTETANGRYEITDISSPSTYVEITAIGNEVVTANDSVSVKIKIMPRDFLITIIR